VAAELQTYLQTASCVQREIGTSPTTDFISGDLFVAVKGALVSGRPHVRDRRNRGCAARCTGRSASLWPIQLRTSTAAHRSCAMPFVRPRRRPTRLAGFFSCLALTCYGSLHPPPGKSIDGRQGSLRVLPLAPKPRSDPHSGPSSRPGSPCSRPYALIGQEPNGDLRSNTIFPRTRTASAWSADPLGRGSCSRERIDAARAVPPCRYGSRLSMELTRGRLFRNDPGHRSASTILLRRSSRSGSSSRCARSGRCGLRGTARSNWIDLSPTNVMSSA